MPSLTYKSVNNLIHKGNFFPPIFSPLMAFHQAASLSSMPTSSQVSSEATSVTDDGVKAGSPAHRPNALKKLLVCASCSLNELFDELFPRDSHTNTLLFRQFKDQLNRNSFEQYVSQVHTVNQQCFNSDISNLFTRYTLLLQVRMLIESAA